MGFTIRQEPQPVKMIRTRTGKSRPSLLQPPQIKVELHHGPTDRQSLEAPLANGPRQSLEKIIEESRQILRAAGIPDRPVVLISGATYRPLTVKEKSSSIPHPWMEIINGEKWIRVRHPKWREATKEDLTNPFVIDPSVFTQPHSVEGFAAAALRFAQEALHTIDSGREADALGLAMRAADFYWKTFVLQIEPALLAGVDVCRASKKKGAPHKIVAKLQKLRTQYPSWGATAIRQQAAEEFSKEGAGRGYGFETLKKYGVPAS